MKKRIGAATLIMSCVASFAIAVLLSSYMFVSKYGGMDVFPYATKFASVFSTIENNYIGEADMEKVSDAAYSAMVSAIDDRWSYYMTAQQYEEYQQYQLNRYQGIGVTIEPDEAGSYPHVVGVVEDSPAQKAGIKIGDVLIKIDEVSLEGMSAAQVKELINERQESEFSITVKSEGGEKKLNISVEPVFSNPVTYELLADNIGYVKIKNFEGESGERIVLAVDDLIAQGVGGIVFDVRNNPGGLLSELITALDHLLPEGTLFISRDKQGVESTKTSDAEFVDIPIAVLINENTYSAAEFFPAALSEYGRAITVGTHTTGKSRSQINIVLSDGSAVHLSTNGYLTPKGVDLSQAGGLSPDVEIGMDEELIPYLASGIIDYEKDEQLMAAITALNQQMKN